MTHRVDKLECKVARIEILAWTTLALTILGLLLRIAQALHWIPEPAPGTAPSGNSNAVHIGTAAAVPESSRKTYHTTAEVAARENIAERTVIQWIEQGRIFPAPVKTGRSWSIAADYRIQPQMAAESCTPPF